MFVRVSPFCHLSSGHVRGDLYFNLASWPLRAKWLSSFQFTSLSDAELKQDRVLLFGSNLCWELWLRCTFASYWLSLERRNSVIVMHKKSQSTIMTRKFFLFLQKFSLENSVKLVGNSARSSPSSQKQNKSHLSIFFLLKNKDWTSVSVVRITCPFIRSLFYRFASAIASSLGLWF